MELAHSLTGARLMDNGGGILDSMRFLASFPNIANALHQLN